MKKLGITLAALLTVLPFTTSSAWAATGTPATGTINTVPGAALSDGLTFTIDDGAGGHVVFGFTSGVPVSGADVAVPFASGSTAEQVKDNVIQAVNTAPGLAVTASDLGYAAVGLVNDVPGATGNVAITANVGTSGLTFLGMSGGSDDGHVSPLATPATGTINTVPGAPLHDGETFTIDDGAGVVQAFEFDSNLVFTLGHVAVPFLTTSSAAQVKSAVIGAVNGAPGLAITASDAGYAAVRLVNDVAGSAGNTAMTRNVAAAGFTLIGMTGGRDADTTPPAAGLAVSGAPGDNGWFTSDVGVDWHWTDLGSGVDPDHCTQQSVSSGEGPSVVVTAACQDMAGNSTSDSVTEAIDKTAPAVAVTGVTNGGRYALGSVPTAHCGTTDVPSGVATAAALSLTTTGSQGVGPFTATCAGAVDVAGNPGAPVSASYTVVYPFQGFLQPVDNQPVVNVTRAGKAVPVKFRLGGNRGLDIFAVGSPSSSSMTCRAAAHLDTVEQTVAAASSSLRYDATTGTYTYVWKTSAAWAHTCRQLTLRLADGTTHTALFKLT